jgi:hypothetical protein
MEGGDEPAGVKRGHSFARPPTERSRRRRDQGPAGSSISHRATCEDMPTRPSKSAQRHFTDCLAALGQCVGLLQVFDADRAERLRLGRARFALINKL